MAEGLQLYCERRDSNPHGFPRQNLNLVRLPIPPLSQGSRDLTTHVQPVKNGGSDASATRLECPRPGFPRLTPAAAALTIRGRWLPEIPILFFRCRLLFGHDVARKCA